MPRIELIPEPRPDGTVALRAVVIAREERLRRLIRRVRAMQAARRKSA
jgi:hypothetical protein